MICGTCIGIIIVLAIVTFALAGVIHLAACVTGNGDRGFGAAISCAIAQMVIITIVGFALRLFETCFLPVWGSFIISTFITIAIIQALYETTWGKAFIMWLIMEIVFILLLLIIILPQMSALTTDYALTT